MRVLLADLQPGAHVMVAMVTLGALLFVLRLVRLRRLQSKYALLWLGVGLVLGVLAAFPGLLKWISDGIGVFYPPTLFLALACAFLFLVVVHFSWELSRLEDRTRVLAEEVAMLRAERGLGAPRDAAPVLADEP
jgi:hypothetical protein